MPGRGKDVADREILSAMDSIEGPFMVSSELEPLLPIKQNQINNRLKEMQSLGFVESKTLGRGKGWWITEKGQRYLEGELDASDMFGEGSNDS